MKPVLGGFETWLKFIKFGIEEDIRRFFKMFISESFILNIDLNQTTSDKAFKGNVENQALLFCMEGHLKLSLQSPE